MGSIEVEAIKSAAVWPTHRLGRSAGSGRRNSCAADGGRRFVRMRCECGCFAVGRRRRSRHLCRGFVAVAAVAPSLDQVRRAFRELPLYSGGDPDGSVRRSRWSTWRRISGAATQPAAAAPTSVRVERSDHPAGPAGADPAPDRDLRVGLRRRHRPADHQRASAAHLPARRRPRPCSVTLTWTADYALAGGAFQPIGDTTTTTSPPRILPVREAQASSSAAAERRLQRR